MFKRTLEIEPKYDIGDVFLLIYFLSGFIAGLIFLLILRNEKKYLTLPDIFENIIPSILGGFTSLIFLIAIYFSNIKLFKVKR